MAWGACSTIWHPSSTGYHGLDPNSARLDNGNREPLAAGDYQPTNPWDIGQAPAPS